MNVVVQVLETPHRFPCALHRISFSIPHTHHSYSYSLRYSQVPFLETSTKPSLSAQARIYLNHSSLKPSVLRKLSIRPRTSFPQLIIDPFTPINLIRSQTTRTICQCIQLLKLSVEMRIDISIGIRLSLDAEGSSLG